MSLDNEQGLHQEDAIESHFQKMNKGIARYIQAAGVNYRRTHALDSDRSIADFGSYRLKEGPVQRITFKQSLLTGTFQYQMIVDRRPEDPRNVIVEEFPNDIECFWRREDDVFDFRDDGNAVFHFGVMPVIDSSELDRFTDEEKKDRFVRIKADSNIHALPLERLPKERWYDDIMHILDQLSEQYPDEVPNFGEFFRNFMTQDQEK